MRIREHILLVCLSAALFCGAGCKRIEPQPGGPSSAPEFGCGEKVMFSSLMPTRTSKASLSFNSAAVEGFSTIADAYTLSVTMYEEGREGSIGTCSYKPVTSDEGVYDDDGLLEACPIVDSEDESKNETPLLWHSNAKKYAFKAEAGTPVLESDQGSREKWLAQDRLLGYAYAPMLDSEVELDNMDALNYHSNKEWGAYNKVWMDAQGEMLQPDDYKRIPLFLKHQRSWITVILKAGNGVSRDVLNYDETVGKNSCRLTFYSYDGDNVSLVDIPFAEATKIDYEKDKNGEAESQVPTTMYHAIVEPHDYIANATEDRIVSISLSGLNFHYMASNDTNYEASIPGESQNEAAVAAMNAYRLEAGKHLTITATLTTDRIVFITAWIEDWIEDINDTVCDDYGQKGDPILINSREDLIAFLNDQDLNKQGNVAIIVANNLDLDKKITGTGESASITDDPWSQYNGATLNATLNMAGAALTSGSRFLENISSTGTIVNGVFVMSNTSPVEAAICLENNGTLERVNVEKGREGASAGKAGLTVVNYGTIYQCNSTLPVYGSDDYLGGIAAQSIYHDPQIMPVIYGCTVNAPVKGDKDNVLAAGGIVGQAEGRVTNNRFSHGITLLQGIQFKNIIGKTTGSNSLRAEDNWWPTKTLNKLDEGDALNLNANAGAEYENVLDCQEELEELLKSIHNAAGKKYRISADFTVRSESWNHGKKHDNLESTEEDCAGNLYCELHGNGHTISLEGSKTVPVPSEQAGGKATAYENKTSASMLFSNITGVVKDLTIYLAQPLISEPAKGSGDILSATDAIAPLAYSVTGSGAKISNVKVKTAESAFIQSAMPAGLVCWAYGGATVEDCQVRAKVLSWLPQTSVSAEEGEDVSDARRYAGGIVASAAVAKIQRCTFHSCEGTLKQAYSTGNKISYGGILGSTRAKVISGLTEYPAVSLVDCISWLEPADEGNMKGGAILGYAVYKDAGSNLTNGTVTEGDDMCQGNWWNNAFNAVGERLWGMSDESIVGKCNSYTPVPDKDY